ncbi:Protein disulfide-isomerase [Papilio xuthus]|uniref:Protein disulfide-isomerase n=1 Tax=Papilio xuthus TaxID=66420 RepID=I4DIQ3_PAPXU|nr:protein disulfide-isomerase precursor [Papilio xuthus]KPI97250.1 Protein disulfide-isomerase [Papilio xuthus]BAM17793.1 protein disulfide isomerase [Papilio xuthus]
MRVTLFAVAIALLGAAFADEIPTEDNVLVLSKANFENVISTTDFILVEFYAPWCGHCKSLAPEYAKAATKLNEEESPIKLAKVDATQEQDLAESFGVRGYPTLKFFKNGNPIDYTGGRQADDIVAWLKKKTGPPAVEVTSAEQAKELIAANNVITFGFFPDQATEKAKAFLNVAGLVDDQVFALVSDEKLIEELEAEAGDVVLFKNFEEPRVKYDAKELDEDLLKTWVFVQSMPTIVEFSHETASKIFGGQIKYHLLLFLSKKNGDFEKYLDDLKPVAKNYRDKIMAVAIDTDEDDHQRILEFFGMKKDEVPSARLIALEQDMAKYKPASSELTANTIEEFIQSFFAGTLKQHLLSEDLPEDWAAKPVKVLVATNFDEVVFDTNKKVLVEFYAPWCGHCKQLVPIYDKLGEHFAADDDVVIAKMDATANELEHTKITSFPTIKLYTKDNQVREYNGERTLAGLTKFVETNGEGAEPTPSVSEDDEDNEAPSRDEL